MKKSIAFGIILLFILSTISSMAVGNVVIIDDNTPPVTTCTLDPATPDGENGWYISYVSVTLEATDDLSGVNATYYRVDGGEWETYTEPFILSEDGMHGIEYYSVDNAGNVEDVKSVEFKIDQTEPEIKLYYEPYKEGGIWYVTFTAICNDATSGMDQVEFYINKGLAFTDYKEPFEWTIEWSADFKTVTFKAVAYDQAGNSDYDVNGQIAGHHVKGLICNLEVTNQSVTFYAVIVRYTYPCDCGQHYQGGILMFKHLSFPNNYKGYIGKFSIRATFYKY